MLCYAELGAKVFVSDQDDRTIPEYAALAASGKIQDLRPRDDAALIDECLPLDMVVTAPGVPLSQPMFVRAREKGIPVYGENDFGYEILSKRWKKPPLVCAITGTDGKSTTTALLDHLARAAGVTSVPCGNFGTPLSSLVGGPETQLLSLECSSFQLEPARFLHANAAVILNLSQDHMDRYRNLDEYLEAKLNVTRNQTSSDVLIAPAWILDRAKGPFRRISMESLPQRPVLQFRGQDLCDAREFRLTGSHNRSNLEVALAALDDLCRRAGHDVEREKLAQAIREFRGLPHRMETVLEKEGVLYVNDSKATTVQAVCSGLTAFSGRRVALLCGGYDKGLHYGELAGFANVELFPFGAAGPKIQQDTKCARLYSDLKQALGAAREYCRQSSGVVYLGPACASYDAYNSYEERGEHFKSLVREAEGM